MSLNAPRQSFSRRQAIALATAAAIAPALPSAAQSPHKPAPDIYPRLLTTWCDGLLAHQVSSPDPTLDGALLCPACAMVHGRCGDAVYPLLCAARITGQSKYIAAAKRVHAWSERMVSQPDGSWINDVMMSSWKGITVFKSISLGEALEHHGALLDAATRAAWKDRLAKAAKFLDGFITMETGNINYPITSSYAFALCGKVLGEPHYTERAKALAHESLSHFTANGILFGEGHPLDAVTAKGCRPVDLGYNVEESLPALAMYATITGDDEVKQQVVKALKAHAEFMLPNGAWDNSWGSRNYKWSWWGSRTSDGCSPAYVLMADADPAFRTVAFRNTLLMQDCTDWGGTRLLYGGPDYRVHGELPCVHHTFTHAKAIAVVLDRGTNHAPGTAALPRETASGVKTFPEIGTHLAAIGPWRATVTENDFDYVEQVQAGNKGGGHVTGGALSMLYHLKLGPILTASMTAYTIIESSNQQVYRDARHMELTPRLEIDAAKPFVSVADNEAKLNITADASRIAFEARGRMLTGGHVAPKSGDVGYRMRYELTPTGVKLTAVMDSAGKFWVPVVSRSGEAVVRRDAKTVEIRKPGGALVVRTDAAFEDFSEERTFNLVPGVECLALAVKVTTGREVSVWLS